MAVCSVRRRLKWFRVLIRFRLGKTVGSKSRRVCTEGVWATKAVRSRCAVRRLCDPDYGCAHSRDPCLSQSWFLLKVGACALARAVSVAQRSPDAKWPTLPFAPSSRCNDALAAYAAQTRTALAYTSRPAQRYISCMAIFVSVELAVAVVS